MHTLRGLLRKLPEYILLLAGGILMVFPFIWMVSVSLKPNSFVIQIPPELIPKDASLANFIQAWTANKFQVYFLNSAFVAITSTIFCVLFSAMAAYAFARFKFPGREAIFYTLLGVMMVPTTIAIIPQFFLMKYLGLRNSLYGLILICAASLSSCRTSWRRQS